MTKYDEYCYNLMELAVSEGAKGKGLTKEECVAYMNMMFGARGVEDYIKEAEATEAQRQMEKAEEYKKAFKKMPGIEVDESAQTHAVAVNAAELAKKMAENSASGMTAEEYEKAIAKAPIEEVELAADLFKETADDKENEKIFISQPMRGKTDEEILEERAAAYKLIKNVCPEAELIDTFFNNETISEKHAGLRYLSKSIDMLDEADAVWMMPGWKEARGCIIEHDCAIAYGIPVHYLY